MTFTATEAAFLLREPVKVVKKAIDGGPIAAKLVRRAGGAVRTVEPSDLLYLFAMRGLRDQLTPKARTEFYRALKRTSDGAREVRFGHLSVEIGDIEAEMRARARHLAELAEAIAFRDDGEPLLKGTHVEAHRIAALAAGGMSADEIVDDYPSLTRQMVETAKQYAEAYPKAGRPYPAQSVKRAMKGAGLEALDEVLDGEA